MIIKEDGPHFEFIDTDDQKVIVTYVDSNEEVKLGTLCFSDENGIYRPEIKWLLLAGVHGYRDMVKWPTLMQVRGITHAL